MSRRKVRPARDRRAGRDREIEGRTIKEQKPMPRNRLEILLLLLALAALPASAQKISIEYDRDAPFGSYRTFAWYDTPRVSLADTAAFMHSRIKNAIENELTRGGLIEDTEDPDLLVTYYGEEWDEVKVSTAHVSYGYGPGWYSPYRGPSYAAGGSAVTTYPKGTLIIDIADARTQKLIWRGTSTGTISENPDKFRKKIEAAISKLARKWKRMSKEP
jgi:hypothetical protein